MYNSTKNILKRITKYSVATIVILGIVVPAGVQAAFLENVENIPQQPVLKDMYTAINSGSPYTGGWGQAMGGGTNNKCGYEEPKYNNAGWTWISDLGNNSDTLIELDEDQDSRALRYNATAAFCDSIIDNTTQRITDTTLKESRTRVLDASLRYLGPDSRYLNQQFGAVSKLKDTVVIHNFSFNHNDGQGNQRRFVKYQGSQPYYKEFDVTGLSALDLEPGEHEIALYTNERPVNRFVYGSNNTVYRCVVNSSDTVPQSYISQGGNPYDWPGCQTSGPVIKAKIVLTINRIADGTCSFLTPLQTVADANTVIPVRIRGTNTGLTTWNQVNYQLKALAENELDETGSANNDGKIYMNNAVPPGGSYDFIFNVKAPEKPTEQAIFKWAIYNGNQRISNVCAADVRIKNNTPYLHISGGDVYSGALFANSAGICTPIADDPALRADIRTSGYFDFSNQAEVFKQKGFSGSQYAVFATGQIGDNSSGISSETFLGNYGYNRPQQNNIKDALFANIGGEDENDYGNFDNDTASGYACVRTAKLLTGSRKDVTESPESIMSSSIENDIAELSNGNKSITSLTTVNGRKVLYINGDLAINQNIQYPASYSSVAEIPNLTVIVKGNILIANTVSRLDGMYIALPVDDNTAGIIDTCSGVLPAGAKASAAMTTTSCNTKLTVNGSVAARKIIWKRTHGTLGKSLNAADPACYYEEAAQITTINGAVVRMKACAAESIEFSPEAYIGSFTGDTTISNIPSSTVELPPVY